MPRSEARIHVSIWDDDDWRGLSMGAQWLYELLLSQPDLTLCGVLAYRPARWAQLARGMTAARVGRLVSELEQPPGCFVLVDRGTQELLVRTFMRHDGVLGSPLVLKGAARSTALVESRFLLGAIAGELPPQVRHGWPDWYMQAPKQAVSERLSPTPTETLSDTPSQTPVERGGEPPSSFLHPPVTKSPHNSKSVAPDPADDEIEAEAQRRTDARSGLTDPAAYRAKVAADLRATGWRPEPLNPSSTLADARTVMAEHMPDPADVAPPPDHLRNRKPA